MARCYVRLVPFNKKAGALCRRFCAGGQLFKEGLWYRLEHRAAELLREEKQGSGCPVFEIIESEEVWRRKVRRELALAMGGPAAAAMSDELARPAPSVSDPPRAAGEVIHSKFAGLEAREVSEGEAVKAAASGLTGRGRKANPKPGPKAVPKQKSPQKRQPRRKPSPRRAPAKKKT